MTSKNQPRPKAFWDTTPAELMAQLGSSPSGLSPQAAAQRLVQPAAARLNIQHRRAALGLLLGQFKSPIVLILLFAAGLSFFLGDRSDAAIILCIVLASGLLSFWQEKRASDAVSSLLSIVQIKAMVRRAGKEFEIPVEEVVPGDVVVLNAGDVVPSDCRILESKDLYVDEAALTGETFPVEKVPGLMPAETPLSARTNCLFMGSHIVSGTAAALAIAAGADTEFGRIAGRLKLQPPETEFEDGVRRFGYFLMELTLILVVAIFAINVYLLKPVLDSFLFALALAVGLTPQLLPAIISVNLAHGARRMASIRVIVKRLASIENFGSMTVLCTDKTGTITQGVAKMEGALGIQGEADSKVLEFARVNAAFQTGYTNPMDAAIAAHGTAWNSGTWQKLDELPYDFVRRRISVLARQGDSATLITKGAVRNVLAVCSHAQNPAGEVVALDSLETSIQHRFEEFSRRGFRVLGVSCRAMQGCPTVTEQDETGMTFLGFLLFSDPLREGIETTLQRLHTLGGRFKIITGDNALVAAETSRRAGLASPRVLTGKQLQAMSDAALIHRVNRVDVFAEVDPTQKERIILSLRKSGEIVGYLGDGINDAAALHAADVGISVDNAVDVAKEAADIVLLEKDLAVLERGVREGRVTFANTLKYVFMATSANFGNMFSMAGASLFLPFLPLLPKQILLLNLLTDLPEMAIATDQVDSEWVDRPQRWDLKFIRRFMLTFGLISSLFDYLTFGLLVLLFHSSPAQFRTGWFLESVISASLVVLVIRTRRPFFRSKPAWTLLFATIMVWFAALALPFSSLAEVFGFGSISPALLAGLLLVIILYLGSAEIAKKIFYRRLAAKAPQKSD